MVGFYCMKKREREMRGSLVIFCIYFGLCIDRLSLTLLLLFLCCNHSYHIKYMHIGDNDGIEELITALNVPLKLRLQFLCRSLQEKHSSTVTTSSVAAATTTTTFSAATPTSTTPTLH